LNKFMYGFHHFTLTIDAFRLDVINMFDNRWINIIYQKGSNTSNYFQVKFQVEKK